MNSRFKMYALSLATCMAFSAAPVIAQGGSSGANEPHLESWKLDDLYRGSWSAEQMIGADVRTRDGQEIGEVKDIIVGSSGEISKVVVEVGGFLEIGDQHIGVPWKHVQLGSRLDWISVPLREVENGTYSLYGRIPQGEEVVGGVNTWRVNELIGDFASLSDVPRYGIVADVLFGSDGKAKAVVVDRTRGPWGAYGYYAYPYREFDARAPAYALPYATPQIVSLTPFDYRQLADRSDFANDEGIRFSGARMSPPERSAESRNTPDRSFNSLDIDNDGRLSHAEVAGLPGVVANFGEADRNGDRSLSRSEYDDLRTKWTGNAVQSSR